MSAPVILTLTEENFDEHLAKSTVPILVDFWADWCVPCKVLAPTLDELADEFDGRALVAKIDVQQNGDFVNRFGISSIPTLILFRDGKIVDQLIGAAPKDRIRKMVSRHLS